MSGSLGLHSRIMGLDWTELIMLNGLFLVRFFCLFVLCGRQSWLLVACCWQSPLISAKGRAFLYAELVLQLLVTVWHGSANCCKGHDRYV